jgi:hypothetical protein
LKEEKICQKIKIFTFLDKLLEIYEAIAQKHAYTSFTFTSHIKIRKENKAKQCLEREKEY